MDTQDIGVDELEVGSDLPARVNHKDNMLYLGEPRHIYNTDKPLF
jgi:hypothetical protein